MKKYLALAAIALVSVGGLFAQSGKLAVGGDPIMLLAFDLRAHAEYAITDNISIKADLEYSPNYFWVSNIQVLGLLVHGRYYLGDMFADSLPEGAREYFQGPALKGLFVGAGAGFFSLRYDYSSIGVDWIGTYFAPTILFEVGTKIALDRFKLANWYVEPAFGANIFLGGEWTWEDSDGNEYDSVSFSDPSYGGFYYSFCVGYLF